MRKPHIFVCISKSPLYSVLYVISDDGPKVSDFIDLTIWKKKKVCCGIIFVNAFGEAIVDPRFFKPCHKKSENKELTESLLSFESIIKEELESVQKSHGKSQDCDDRKVPDRKERKDSEKSFESKFSSDHDEGFCDRSSCSPCFEESHSSTSKCSSSTSISSISSNSTVSINNSSFET